MAQIALTTSAPFVPFNCGAKRLSKSVLVCSSRRCASSSTLSFTSFSTRLGKFELGASPAAAASNEGFEEVVQGQPLPALGYYTWADKKVGLSLLNLLLSTLLE